jgi:hypothetical protein
MKTRYFIFMLYIPAFFIMNTSVAQTMIPKKCYMHLTGQIGKKYGLTMELVKINDSIYADWHSRALTKDAGELAGSAGQDANVRVFCGKMKADGSFTLHLPFTKKGPLLTGQLGKDQKLSGTWEDGNVKLPFELTEKYTGGSVQLNVSWLKGSQPLVKKPGSPKGTIEMALLTPAESSNPLISDSLKKIILGKFAKRDVTVMNPEANLTAMKKAFDEKYISSNEELYANKVGGANLNWESLEFMHVLFNENHFLTFYVISYAFTGGAHGLETQEFYSIDLNSGKVLTLTDIFNDGYEKDLGNLITGKLKELYSLRQNQLLTEAGFFTDDVKPIDNFYVTGDGIGFFYNHYEIAPYANSPNNCFIGFDELKPLLRQGGVTHTLLQ